MKKIVKTLCVIVLMIIASKGNAQNIAINETGNLPDTSAMLDVSSTTKGLLVPRLTTTQQDAIPLPAKGLLIFNTTTNTFMVNYGTPASPDWVPAGNISTLNGLTTNSQTFATGSSGTDFNISSSGSAHTFNIPSASTSNRGLITNTNQTIGGKKTFNDTLTAASAVVINTISSGSATDSILTVNDAGVVKKRSISDFVTTTPPNYLTFVQDNFEDFVFDTYAGSGSNDNQFAFTQAIAGTGASSQVDGTAALYTAGGAGNDYAGIHVLTTGTSTTGAAGLGSFNNINKMKVGGKQVVYEIRVRFENLSDATNTYTGYFGLSDLGLLSGTVPAGAPTNGIYFTYTHGTNSGKWVATTRSAGTSTTYNTNIAVNANQWYRIKANINSTGTQIDYYIDGTYLGSVTTNIPTAPMKLFFKLEKSAGTTSRTCSIDYIGWRMVRQ